MLGCLHRLNNAFRLCCLTFAVLAVGASTTLAQIVPAQISEEIRTLETYPFSEPNPVPILTRDSRLYPYHSFEGYSAVSEPREWKVVRLENEHIEVWVLPEVGGKVWGARVKKSGHEFIYRNEVMKFRNIALRGPWTSGGIEFNFGVIGHAPGTATPVDYVLLENEDGSVSCIVGGMDLPSRTPWRVEIRLHPGRADFETNVSWHNPTLLEQPYYNWMTAAAFAQDDLEMTIPGDEYLAHSGEASAWPRNGDNRQLTTYAENAFGSNKSYHIVGELNDFFGGYYTEDDYGFGHWARHEDLPGQKLWLWALSEAGGIWETLLTDTDGQYIEFQAGRLLVQYSPSADANPITQAGFDPMSTSRWSESWFPLEGIGGLTDASKDGAMYIEETARAGESDLVSGRSDLVLSGSDLAISVNAFRDINDTLEVWLWDSLVHSQPVTLKTLEAFSTTVSLVEKAPYRVSLRGLGLNFNSDPAERLLTRPFSTDENAWSQIPEADRQVHEARELRRARYFAQARTLYESALEREPWNRDALLGLADLALRRSEYDSGLAYVSLVLQLDTYDPEGNFLAGALHRGAQTDRSVQKARSDRVVGHRANARDAFGWSARSMTYRSASYAQLAEISLESQEFEEAIRYAGLSLDYDRYNLPAWQIIAIAGRVTGSDDLVSEALGELLALDPLHHFVGTERFLSGASEGEEVLSTFGGEFPGQTLLEVAMRYVRTGRLEDAGKILALGSGQDEGTTGAVGPGTGRLLLGLWSAFLEGDADALPTPSNVAFQHPYRTETLTALRWAAEESDDWGWIYLLGLNLWALDRDVEAATYWAALGDRPEWGPFYSARAALLKRTENADPATDLQRAIVLDSDNRTLHILWIQYLLEKQDWTQAETAIASARNRFQGDFNLNLLYSTALLHLGRGAEAAEIMEGTEVLPSEHASTSHLLWELAHAQAAMDALEAGDRDGARTHLEAALEWPESLGQGRPYDPEERLTRFLLGVTEAQAQSPGEAERHFEAATVTPSNQAPDLLDLISSLTLRKGWSEDGASTFRGQAALAFENLARVYPNPFDQLRSTLLLRALHLPEGVR